MALEEGNLVDRWVCGFYIAVTWDESSMRLACLGRYRADGLGVGLGCAIKVRCVACFCVKLNTTLEGFCFWIVEADFGNSWLSLAYNLGLDLPAVLEYIYTSITEKSTSATRFPQKLERYTSCLELLPSLQVFSKVPPPLHQTQPPSMAENP